MFDSQALKRCGRTQEEFSIRTLKLIGELGCGGACSNLSDWSFDNSFAIRQPRCHYSTQCQP